MFGAALALIIIGVLMFFVIFPVGLAVGIVGLVLLVLFLAGIGRRVTETSRRTAEPPQ
jgi:membrane protein implicated in regulation of membrane protease activity